MENDTNQSAVGTKVDLGLDSEQINKHLENLIFTFTTNYEFKLFGKVDVALSTLNNQDQLLVEAEMKDIKGTPAFVVHTYQVKILTHTLKQYADTKFISAGQVQTFITKMPSTVLDIILAHQNEFEKVLLDAAKGEHFKNL
jgi:hypothetical protein